MVIKNIIQSHGVAAYDLGMSIIPLDPGTKDPHTKLLPTTKNGAYIWTPFQTHRASPEQVFEWGAKSPDANYGIVCGSSSEINSCYLYVVDIEEEGLFREMLEEIVALYGETQSVRSKRGGHIYLLSNVPLKGKNRYLNQGFEIKGQGSYVLGEGCRHPEGGWYEIHSNPGVFAIADDLPFCDLEHAPLGRSALSESRIAYTIARQKHLEALAGRFRGETKNYDRSRVMQSIVTTCRNRGMKQEMVRSILKNIDFGAEDGVRCLTHYQAQIEEKSVPAAERSFERCWTFAGSRAMTPEANALRQQMTDLARWVESRPWKGQPGLILRGVLLAHIQRCQDSCNSIYHLDVRSGAEMAQCHHTTFSSKTKWLCGHNFITKMPGGRVGKQVMPNAYKLNPEKFLDDSSTEIFQLHPLTSSPFGSPCLESEENLDLRLATDPTRYRGVFERGGLGKAAERIWKLLHGKRLLPSDISKLTGYNSGSVSRYLKKLRESGLVLKQGRYYTAVENPDFNALSRRLGTGYKAFRRHSRHERQRSDFRERTERKNPTGTNETGVDEALVDEALVDEAFGQSEANDGDVSNASG